MSDINPVKERDSIWTNNIEELSKSGFDFELKKKQPSNHKKNETIFKNLANDFNKT